MLQIFLCYAKDDEKKAAAIYDRLALAGFKPWMEAKDILPGQRPAYVTPQVIAASRVVLICLSQQAVSQGGPFFKQIRLALDKSQEKRESDIYVIPARLDPCDPPDMLSEFKPVDLFESDGWARLLKALKAATGEPVSEEKGVRRTMSTITWLHLSDLHFRQSRAYDANVVLKALARDVNERIEQDGIRPDFIVITGDVAFSGQADEYKLAQVFLIELLRKTGLGPDRLFIVPGKHDTDRNLVNNGAKAIGDSLKDRDKTNELLATPADWALMTARFKGYKKFFNDYFANRLVFDDKNYFYVHKLKVGDIQIALLGLNSAWLCASDEDKAKGLLFGERQTRAALDLAEGADLKIALFHHPFDHLREFDQNDSAAMLMDNCDFILHGHLHQAAAMRLSGPDTQAMVIAGGACYETRQYPNSYNFVRLDSGAGTGTVYLRRYSDARGGFWAKDVLLYRNVPDGTYTFEFRAISGAGLPSGGSSAAQPVPRPADGGGGAAPVPPALGEVDLEVLEQRVMQAYDDVELDRVCLKHFPRVYGKFGAGMRRDQKVLLLLDHCRRFPEEWQKLLSLLGN